MKDVITKYQTNFQLMPDIDTKYSDVFLKEATRIKDAYLLNDASLENTFKTKLKKYKGSDKINLIHAIKSVFSEIKIHTNEDLLNGVKEGVNLINTLFKKYPENDRKWGLLTENLYRPDIIETFKSPEWIASIAWKYLKSKKPSLVPYCVSDIPKGFSHLKGPQHIIKELYQLHNVRHFIIFDDGAYSGNQKAYAIFTETWKELTLNIEKSDPFDIMIVIPFITKQAIETFRIIAMLNRLNLTKETINVKLNYLAWEDPSTHRRVIIWSGKTIMENTFDIVNKKTHEMFRPSTKEDFEICNNLNDFIINEILTDKTGSLGAAFCVFEHKLPDYISLPSVIYDFYKRDPFMAKHFKNNPPYKFALNNKPPPPKLAKVFECSTKVSM